MKLIKKVACLIVFVLVIVAGLGYYSTILTVTDHFYPKFLSKSRSLVIGTSRVMRGINPDVVSYGLEIDRPFLNFAFNISNGSYGPLYYEAIKKKVKVDTQNGIFILEVSPLSLSTRKTNPNDDIELYREQKGVLNSQFISLNPNIEYMIKHARRPVYSTLFKLIPQNHQIHKNGWYVSKGYPPKTVELLTKKTINRFSRKYPNHYLSNKRTGYFVKIVKFLKTRGFVVVIRMPVAPGIVDVEDKFYPIFDNQIGTILNTLGVKYLNYKAKNIVFKTVDGHHLNRQSAIRLSRELNRYLNSQLTRRHPRKRE